VYQIILLCIFLCLYEYYVFNEKPTHSLRFENPIPLHFGFDKMNFVKGTSSEGSRPKTN